jgi:hypothetical protein
VAKKAKARILDTVVRLRVLPHFLTAKGLNRRESSVFTSPFPSLWLLVSTSFIPVPGSSGELLRHRTLPIMPQWSCNWETCKRPAAQRVGDCLLCDKHFCRTHRLEPWHRCPDPEVCNLSAPAAAMLMLTCLGKLGSVFRPICSHRSSSHRRVVSSNRSFQVMFPRNND